MEQFTAIVVTAAGSKQVSNVLASYSPGFCLSGWIGASSEKWLHPEGNLCPGSTGPLFCPRGKVFERSCALMIVEVLRSMQLLLPASICLPVPGLHLFLLISWQTRKLWLSTPEAIADVLPSRVCVARCSCSSQLMSRLGPPWTLRSWKRWWLRLTFYSWICRMLSRIRLLVWLCVVRTCFSILGNTRSWTGRGLVWRVWGSLWTSTMALATVFSSTTRLGNVWVCRQA